MNIKGIQHRHAILRADERIYPLPNTGCVKNDGKKVSNYEWCVGHTGEHCCNYYDSTIGIDGHLGVACLSDMDSALSLPIVHSSDSGGVIEPGCGSAEKVWMALGYAVALAESNGLRDAEARIHHIHDNEGQLEVYWGGVIHSGLSYYLTMAWQRYNNGKAVHYVCRCDIDHVPRYRRHP